jgi:capsular exopolysaccharide synthesis family protein
MKPIYRAHTTVEVVNINEDFMNMKQSSPTTTSNGDSYDTSEEQTQAKLLSGIALRNRVIASLDPDFRAAKRKPTIATSGWRSWVHLNEPIQSTQRQHLLREAADSLKVSPTTHTRVLDVTVDSKDPQLAADFANTLLKEFIQQNLESRYETTHKTGEWLRREIDDARTKLLASEDALQRYARESGLIFTDENTNVATEKLEQVQQQLSAVTADRIAKEARYKLSVNSPPDALADVLGDRGLQDGKAKLNELQRRVASLSAVFNQGYSKLQEAQAELAATKSAYEHDRDQVLQRINTDYQQASTNEKLLAAAYQAQTRNVTGQSEKAIQYNILKREVDSNRQLYDTMLQETKQASIASAMRPSNVRVVDPADTPTKPFWPNFPLNSAIGLFAGLALSIAVVTIRERADRALQQPGDIKLWINLPELGTIPSAFIGKAASYGPTAKTRAAQMLTVARDTTRGVELITLKQKSSAMAEAFRSALTSIFFVGEGDGGPRVLAFTSSNPADGKTTVVSNLAIATAEIRRKVLVIDADLRRPRMHDVFQLSNERGLSDLLAEEFSEQNLLDLVQQTGIPGLHVLTGGPPTAAAANLLYSPNFEVIIRRLEEDFDMIYIDTPPMLQMTDARVTGRLVDAVVLVARVGRTTRDALLAAKDRLEEDRIHVLGTILNDWDPKRAPNGYYRSPYYSNYYNNRYTVGKD